MLLWGGVRFVVFFLLLFCGGEGCGPGRTKRGTEDKTSSMSLLYPSLNESELQLVEGRIALILGPKQSNR